MTSNISTDRDGVTLKLAQKKLLPTEHQEQSLLIQWCAFNTNKYPDVAWLYAIPNFAGRMGKLTLRHGEFLNAEGRKKGYPDLALDVARGPYHGLRIEMKRQHGGRLEQWQKAWHTRLREQGYFVVVCKGWEDARDQLTSYLTLSPC